MSENNYFSSLLRKNLWLYFFSFLIAPIGYIIKIVISNSISVSDVGMFYGVMSFLIILGSINDFGMTESLNYFLPEHLHKKDTKKITQTFSIALVTQIVSSIVLIIALFFGAQWLENHYFHIPGSAGILLILVVQFFAENIFRTINIFFQAIQNTKAQKSLDFLRMLLLMILVVIIWKADLASVTNYAIVWSGAIFLGMIVAVFWIAFRYHSYFSRDGWRFKLSDYSQIFKYAFWVMLSANISMLLSQIDMQMVLYFLGSENAGYYTNYLSLIRIPFLFLLPGVYFLFPVFSDLFRRGQTDTVKTIYTFCYEIFGCLALLMTSFFMLFGRDLSTSLLGSEYAMSGTILIYSAPFLLFNFLMQIDFQILSSTGRPRTKMFILLATLGVNIVTNYIFIHLWGVIGSAVASGLGWLIIWIMSWRATGMHIANFRWSMFFRNLVGIAILSYLFSFVHLANIFHGRLHMILGILLVVVIYAVVFLLLNIFELKRFWRIFRTKHIAG